MSPDDRRRAIVDAVIPLLAEHGREVTTRQIAEAAGVAEGTIFRVFPDKAALLMAAAEEAMSPSHGDEQWAELLGGDDDLRVKVRLAAERVLARIHLVMTVMFAVRGHLVHAKHEHRHETGKPGPPAFVVEAQATLLRQLTALFEPYADELAVPPETAAVALRSLIFGSARAELGMGPSLTADQIADLVLDGTLRKEA